MSLETLRNCGFSDKRTARSELHRRAKVRIIPIFVILLILSILIIGTLNFFIVFRALQANEVISRFFSISKERIGSSTERKAVYYYLTIPQQKIPKREVFGSLAQFALQ